MGELELELGVRNSQPLVFRPSIFLWILHLNDPVRERERERYIYNIYIPRCIDVFCRISKLL